MPAHLAIRPSFEGASGALYSLVLSPVKGRPATVLAPFLHVEVNADHGRIRAVLEVEQERGVKVKGESDDRRGGDFSAGLGTGEGVGCKAFSPSILLPQGTSAK